MSRSKKPRKAYKPREISLNPIEWAKAGVYTFPYETQREIMKAPEEAFDKLRRGMASREDWNIICQSLNIAEALTEFHIGDNLLPDFNAGHEALHQIALRMLAGGSSTCRASELSAIREAMDMHKVQLRFCTQAEFGRAIQRVKNLLNGGAKDDVVQTYARINGETRSAGA